MRVLNRHGKLEPVNFNKIRTRLLKLIQISPELLNIKNNLDMITQQVISEMHDKIPTSKLDELAAEIAIGKYTIHPEYDVLASRIVINNLHKNTLELFSDKIHLLREDNRVTDELYNIVMDNKDLIQNKINYNKDYEFNYFGYKTLERSYLLRNKDQVIIERIQDLLMRVSIGIHGNNLYKAFETFDAMSDKYFIMATPCLFNSGTPNNQLLSCFLLGTDDSCEGIMKTATDCAIISKYAGGIGVHISNIRAKGSLIKGTNGKSSGCTDNLRILNSTMRAFNQGGKRLGSCAIYMEPHHADIMDFLKLKLNTGDENSRARDLFYAIFLNNLFMERVLNNEPWSLFSPDDVPELNNAYGDKYREIYLQAEEDGKMRSMVQAREIWALIINSQIEVGMPYLLNKDEINIKSNQNHYGTIKSSNLCAEICEYSDNTEYACCTLASIGLPKFVEDGVFNFTKLAQVTKILINNLDIIVDINFYPVPETKKSNMLHRPLGLGVQGLANVFSLMNLPFDSVEATLLNKQIFATIYYSALEQSLELAQNKGAYPTFNGSPLSQGKFQFDLWEQQPLCSVPGIEFNWEQLRNDIIKYGVRNSLLLSCQPTAGTSQILGNAESIEPYTHLIYTRSTLSGTFIVIVKDLIDDLIKLNIWSEELKNEIIKNDSIQNIDIVPQNIKNKYKTVWELSMKTIIDMAADRGIYICQTQSLNLFIKHPNQSILSSMYFYAHTKKLKTYVYYLRSLPQSTTQQFTIDPKHNSQESQEETKCLMCTG
jgi:ribonucleoside-diphosphate reductase alpha chain